MNIGGTCYGPKDIKKPSCAICQKEVSANEKVLIDRRTGFVLPFL